jgi:hypothetical protein
MAQNDICSICFDDLDNNSINKLSCNHIFHKDCINEWFSRNIIQTCPYCRKVNENNIWNINNIDEAITFYKNKYNYPNMTREWILDKIRLINLSIPRWREIIIGNKYKVSYRHYQCEYIGTIYEKTDLNEYGNFYCKVYTIDQKHEYFWSNLCDFELIE